MVEEKKIQRGGHCIRYEPKNANAVMEDQMVMEDFIKADCLKFCESYRVATLKCLKIFLYISVEPLPKLE